MPTCCIRFARRPPSRDATLRDVTTPCRDAATTLQLKLPASLLPAPLANGAHWHIAAHYLDIVQSRVRTGKRWQTGADNLLPKQIIGCLEMFVTKGI